MESWISLRRSLSFGLIAWMPGRRTLAVGCMLIALLITCELAGRALGLHTPVLYETTAYGYRVQPQQDILRFGNRYFSNEFGMRSESMTRLPSPGVLRILVLGDSITNGGAITDQMDTYPAQLQRLMKASGRRVEVLNASAPGWGIANEAGWLRVNGSFGAHAVLLTIGTTDLFQEAARAEVVDHHPSFPSRVPPLAIKELWLRYVKPRSLRESTADPGAERVSAPVARSALAIAAAVGQVIAIVEEAKRRDAVPLILFVELPDRFEPTDAMTANAKATLFGTLRAKGIAFFTTQDAVRHSGGESLFRDELHPNTDGNRILARVAAGLIESIAPQEN